MAIRVPNLGTGSGAVGDGDNELKIRQDYNHNFSDQSNAASRLVGITGDQIPVAKDTLRAAYKIPTNLSSFTPAFDPDTCEVGVRYFIASDSPNMPPQDGQYVVFTEYAYALEQVQTALNKNTSTIWIRATTSAAYPFTWSEWRSTSSNPANYTTTTASGANAVITSNGDLQRSTSSERYKDILAPLVLDDAKYAAAMSLKPIVYRSTADADNPLHHFYSFSAEELGAYDPAFTLWRTTEMVTDADGNITEQSLAVRQAEGININALLAMSHAIAIKQDKMIKNLQEQINALKPQMEV